MNAECTAALGTLQPGQRFRLDCERGGAFFARVIGTPEGRWRTEQLVSVQLEKVITPNGATANDSAVLTWLAMTEVTVLA